MKLNRKQLIKKGQRIKKDLEEYYWNMRILLKGPDKELIDPKSDIGQLFIHHLKVLDLIDQFETKEVQDYITLMIQERQRKNQRIIWINCGLPWQYTRKDGEEDTDPMSFAELDLLHSRVLIEIEDGTQYIFGSVIPTIEPDTIVNRYALLTEKMAQEVAETKHLAMNPLINDPTILKNQKTINIQDFIDNRITDALLKEAEKAVKN
jgi:hypothetical protein